MCFLELFWGMGESWWAVEMTCNCLRDFSWEGQMRKNGVAIEIRISLKTILWDAPCVTGRKKLLNACGWIFDACLIGCSHKTAEIHFLWIQLKEYKILDAVVPDKLLTANTSDGSYHIEEYKNSSLVVILRCLNTTTMGHFHYSNERLWKNHKIKAVCFSHFIMAAILHVKYDVGSKWENGKVALLEG